MPPNGVDRSPKPGSPLGRLQMVEATPGARLKTGQGSEWRSSSLHPPIRRGDPGVAASAGRGRRIADNPRAAGSLPPDAVVLVHHTAASSRCPALLVAPPDPGGSDTDVFFALVTLELDKAGEIKCRIFACDLVNRPPQPSSRLQLFMTIPGRRLVVRHGGGHVLFSAPSEPPESMPLTVGLNRLAEFAAERPCDVSAVSKASVRPPAFESAGLATTCPVAVRRRRPGAPSEVPTDLSGDYAAPSPTIRRPADRRRHCPQALRPAARHPGLGPGDLLARAAPCAAPIGVDISYWRFFRQLACLTCHLLDVPGERTSSVFPKA